MTMKPFHLPRRLTRAPITVEEMSTPAIIGMVSRPDSVGVAPRASCMYWLRNTAVPNIATPTEIDAIDREREGAVLEQAERDDRLLHAELDDHGDQEQQGGGADHEEARHGDPLEVLAREGDPEQQQRDAGRDEHDAEVVDRDLGLRALGQVQRALQEHEGDDRDRQADEEVPAPAEGVGDHAAEQRAADGGDGHDRAEEAGVLAALARADDVGHHDLAERREAAGADALEHAHRDERAGVLREPGDRRGDHEDDEGELQEQLAVEEVGELAPDRASRRWWRAGSR